MFSDFVVQWDIVADGINYRINPDTKKLEFNNDRLQRIHSMFKGWHEMPPLGYEDQGIDLAKIEQDWRDYIIQSKIKKEKQAIEEEYRIRMLKANNKNM